MVNFQNRNKYQAYRNKTMGSGGNSGMDILGTIQICTDMVYSYNRSYYITVRRSVVGASD